MLKRLTGPNRRFILVIGNGGAVLVYLARGQVEQTWSISDLDDDSLATFADVLENDRRAPVVVLVDLLEQSYRREPIPPVNLLDRPKVIARRLRIAFPSFEVRAALPLGEQIGQRGDLAYLFVALPSSPELDTWIAFFHGIDNPVASLGLLPVESTGLAVALCNALADDGETPADWALLISREQTGGIRQIVMHGGKLAITRLTPAPAGASGADKIAAAISQELTPTLGYLTRLGYTANDKLAVIVIGSEPMREALAGQQAAGSEVIVLTPSEAAERLGLADIEETGEGYGDVLHAVWAANQRRPTLQMAGEVLGRRQLQMVAARKWLVGGLATAAVVLGVLCADQVRNILLLQDEVEMGRSGETRLKSELNALKRKIEEFPEPPKQITAVLDYHDQLMLQSAAPAPVLAAIGNSLGPSLRLKNLQWKTEDVRGNPTQRQTSNTNQKAPREPGFDVDLAVDLASFSDAERAIDEINGLAERLKEHFTEQKVEIVRPPLDILPTQTLVGFASEDVPEPEPGGLSADITISWRPE